MAKPASSRGRGGAAARDDRLGGLDDLDFEADPVARHAAREARIAFFAWVVAGAITISVSYALGYDGEDGAPPDARTVLGVPLWVFFGVVMPWMGAIAFGCWYSLRCVVDEDLGSEGDDAAPWAPSPAERSEGPPDA